MRKIFAIAWKDALIRFSSKSELLFFIVLPIVFISVMASQSPTGKENNRIRIVVVDQAQSAVSQEILSELENSTSVKPDLMSAQEAQEEFDARRATAMLVIPAGLDLAAIQNGTAELALSQPPNNLNASIARRAIDATVRKVGAAVNAAKMATAEAKARGGFASMEEEQAYFNAALETAKTLQAQTPERLTVVQGVTSNDIKYDPRTNASAGQLITWVFIPLFAISAYLAYERRDGTLRRLLTTPTSKATFLLGVIFGQVAMALVQMTLLVLFAILAFRLNWGNPFGLAIILVCACLAAAAIGTTMGTFVKSEGQATGLSIIAGMLLSLLGGCWYPIELFPQFMQSAARIFPTTWAMQGLLNLSLRGANVTQILPEAGALLVFAVVFFGIGAARFRFE